MEGILVWGYALRSHEHIVRIHGTSGRVEFIADTLSISDWHTLIANIKQDFRRCGPEMSTIRQSLKRWSLFLHGNVDPKQLAFDTVFCDDYPDGPPIPLFRDDRGMSSRYLANSLKFVEPGEALRDVSTVAKCIEFVLRHLAEPARARLERLLREDYLGRNEATGEIDRLFGDAIGEGFVILDGAARPTAQQ